MRWLFAVVSASYKRVSHHHGQGTWTCKSDRAELDKQIHLRPSHHSWRFMCLDKCFGTWNGFLLFPGLNRLGGLSMLKGKTHTGISEARSLEYGGVVLDCAFG